MEIVIIEQREPHAGQMAFRDIAQPESLEARIELAFRMQSEFELNMPVLVDSMEDNSRALFGDLPSPAFLIDADGNVAAKFPWANAEQLESALADLQNHSPDVTATDDAPAGSNN